MSEIDNIWRVKMNKKIMIVDDEEDILNSLKVLLERQNYEVVTVNNGIDCLDKLEEGFQGIILMDLMMPEKDGWEVIKEIVERGLTDEINIEIITGKGTKDNERMQLLGSYIFDYHTKPIDVKKLINSVEKCYDDLIHREKIKKIT
jgi:DNA-binding response OmpR family regulator